MVWLLMIDSNWKELAKSYGLTIDDNKNTRIIVDKIVSWADSFKCWLTYMRSQLIVCRAYRLLLALGKDTSSHIGLSSSASTFALKAIALLNLSISCSRLGQPPSWSEMWLSFVDSCSSICVLFLTLKFALPLYAWWPNRNSPRLSGHIGRQKHKELGMTWRMQSCPTCVSSTLTIAN